MDNMNPSQVSIPYVNAVESASYNIKYPLKQISKYRFDKSTLRHVSKMPRMNPAPVIRIAPPEPTSINLTNDRYVSNINDRCDEEVRNDNYFQITRDNRRKRNYAQEETDRIDSTPKKSRRNDIKNVMSHYKRSHEDSSQDSLEDMNPKKRCSDSDRSIAKMMSYTSSMSVIVPHLTWDNHSKKRKSSKIAKSKNESPENVEKLRKIAREETGADLSKCYEEQKPMNTIPNATYVVRQHIVPVQIHDSVEPEVIDEDEGDGRHVFEPTLPDDDGEYVKVASGKILNRTNCTYRKKLNTNKIDPESIISLEPELVNGSSNEDDDAMKKSLLKNLIDDIERRGEKDESVIFYENSIVEEIAKNQKKVEFAKSEISNSLSSPGNPLLSKATQVAESGNKPTFNSAIMSTPSIQSQPAPKQLDLSTNPLFVNAGEKDESVKKVEIAKSEISNSLSSPGNPLLSKTTQVTESGNRPTFNSAAMSIPSIQSHSAPKQLDLSTNPLFVNADKNSSLNFNGSVSTTPLPAFNNDSNVSINNSSLNVNPVSANTMNASSATSFSTTSASSFSSSTTPAFNGMKFGSGLTPSSGASPSTFGTSTTVSTSFASPSMPTFSTAQNNGFGMGSSGFGSSACQPQTNTSFGDASNQCKSNLTFGNASNQSQTNITFGNASSQPQTNTFGNTTNQSQTNTFGNTTNQSQTNTTFGNAASQPQTNATFGNAASQLQTNATFGNVANQSQTNTKFGNTLTQPQPNLTLGNTTNQSQTNTTFGNAASQPQMNATFGNAASQPQTNATFGNVANQSQTSTTFGNSLTQPQPNLTLGNTTNQSQTNTTFGNAANQPQTNATFGNAASQPQTNATFGNVANQSQTTTTFGNSLTQPQPNLTFGNTTNQSQTNTTFGNAANQPQTNATFGNAVSQSQTNVTFGNVANQSQTNTTFGNSLTQPQPNLTFGNTANPAQPAASAFGNATNPSQTNPTFGTSQLNAFGNTQLFGSGDASINQNATVPSFGASNAQFGNSGTFSFGSNASNPPPPAFGGATTSVPFGGAGAAPSSGTTFNFNSGSSSFGNSGFGGVAPTKPAENAFSFTAPTVQPASNPVFQFGGPAQPQAQPFAFGGGAVSAPTGGGFSIGAGGPRRTRTGRRNK